jgi:hypothetical protein
VVPLTCNPTLCCGDLVGCCLSLKVPVWVRGPVNGIRRVDGGGLYPIGDLARRTGLAVRTIRFYSDCGIVAPAGRSPAGYRLYGVDAVARLDLVRTLRDLGVDLPTMLGRGRLR